MFFKLFHEHIIDNISVIDGRYLGLGVNIWRIKSDNLSE
jgi:hypothetical protein